MRVKPDWVTNETWDYDTPSDARLIEIANDGDTTCCAETEAIAIELYLSRQVVTYAELHDANTDASPIDPTEQRLDDWIRNDCAWKAACIRLDAWMNRPKETE